MMQLKPQEKNRKRSNKSLWVKMQRSSCRRYDLEEGALIYYRFCIHNNTTKKKKVKYSKQDGHLWKKKIYKAVWREGRKWLKNSTKGQTEEMTPLHLQIHWPFIFLKESFISIYICVDMLLKPFNQSFLQLLLVNLIL